RLALLAQRIDDRGIEPGLARELLVDQPLVLAGPAPRSDQDGELDQSRREFSLPAQLLAEALQVPRNARVVQQRDERPADFAARTGGDRGGHLALLGAHRLRRELGKAWLCHAAGMIADAILVVHFLIVLFIVGGLIGVW